MKKAWHAAELNFAACHVALSRGKIADSPGKAARCEKSVDNKLVL